MSDEFLIVPYRVRSAGTDVPPEEVQTAINSLAQQTTIALNVLSTQSEPPTGPAGGDLSGTYPNPTVSAVHATSGTITGVTVDNSVIGGTTPAAGHFTTISATTAIPVTSGGTGLNALTAHAVVLGEGSSAVAFAAPGAAGTLLASNGTTSDPTFQTTTALNVALTTNPLSQFAATTSAQLAGVISDETGSGALVFGTNATLSGTTITGGALNGTLGATTPSTVAATTVSATGTITPSATNGIVGTTTNNNANAGSVGETITATGSSVAITNATATNVTSISLTAGDWDVWGAVGFVPTTVTSIGLIAASISPTSATQVAIPNITLLNLTFTVGNQGIVAPTQRISLATTTTYFLVATINFIGGTEAVSGTITARRRR